MWGATCSPLHQPGSNRNFNPRTPCGVRLAVHVRGDGHVYFNPRTPCGVRLLPESPVGLQLGISIHAPRVGCDVCPPSPHCVQRAFQSTHPVWGATDLGVASAQAHGDFNPRTPCGVRPLVVAHICAGQCISIHAPRVGCDSMPASASSAASQFQSTHPVWGATLAAMLWISARVDFNPRTPCGVRPGQDRRPGHLRHFNPRTPCGVRPVCHDSMD